MEAPSEVGRMEAETLLLAFFSCCFRDAVTGGKRAFPPHHPARKYQGRYQDIKSSVGHNHP